MYYIVSTAMMQCSLFGKCCLVFIFDDFDYSDDDEKNAKGKK
jgi:hypothetical protein